MRFKINERGKDKQEWRHPRLTQAVTFYAKTLRIPNPKELDITLKLSHAKNMVNENTRGECNPVLESYINGNLHEFTITMQGGMPWTWTLETFAHEMVHAWQLANGRLRIAFKSRLWMYSWEQGQWGIPAPFKTQAYLDQPWEVEARAKQHFLCQAFFDVEKTTGVFQGS